MQQSVPAEAQNINAAKLNTGHFLPALLRLTEVDQLFPWDRIDRDFSTFLQENTSKAQGENMKLEANLFLTMIAARKGQSDAIGMLHFLHNVFEDLDKLLLTKEKQLIIKNIKDLLTTFNLEFYNYVGELATLNNLMTTKIYRLENVESLLDNGQEIDFEFRKIDNGEKVFVEVVNIHLDSNRVESDPIAIDKFLTYRSTKKINKKTAGLQKVVEFYLVPVLWGTAKDIEIYTTHFKNNPAKPSYVIEPIAYLRHSGGHLYFDHQFGRVSSLLRKDKQ